MDMSGEFMEIVRDDIEHIDGILEQGSDDERWQLFRELDAKYQVCIIDWYRGMWQSSNDGKILYIGQLHGKPEYVKDNLKYARAKLIAFSYQMNAVKTVDNLTTQLNVTTNVNVNLSFEEAREKVENMTALSDKQSKEIIDKINELEAISKEPITRKKKWEKVKPILAFVMDKGADAAIAIMTLILQMKLGA